MFFSLNLCELHGKEMGEKKRADERVQSVRADGALPFPPLAFRFSSGPGSCSCFDPDLT